MPSEEPNVHSMIADIRLLQQGQQHIQSAVTSMSLNMERMTEAISELIRLTEKHNALSDRVNVLEQLNKERTNMANMGRAYMFAGTLVVPFVIGSLYWLGNEVVALKEKTSKHETHYESHR